MAKVRVFAAAMRSFRAPLLSFSKGSIWLGGNPDKHAEAALALPGKVLRELEEADDCCCRDGDLFDLFPVNPLKTPASPLALRASDDWVSSPGDGDMSSRSSEAGWPIETIRRSMLAWSRLGWMEELDEAGKTFGVMPTRQPRMKKDLVVNQAVSKGVKSSSRAPTLG